MRIQSNSSVEVFAKEIEQRHFARERMPTVKRLRGAERVSMSNPPATTIGDLFPQADWDWIKRAVA